MKLLAPMLLLASCSCSLFFDSFADESLPIRDPEAVAREVEWILTRSDLNQDGVIQGSDEWLEFARRLTAAIVSNLER